MSVSMTHNGQALAMWRYSVFRPGILKPNKITKVEVTYIDAAKQVEPDMKLGYALKMKDAFHLECLRQATM